MPSAEIETQPADSLAGYRLQRFELWNWGTFHNQVWKIEPMGHNALLTGDIGSGKSTLVDALTTLLVPAHKITYNQAAGAERRERSLNSYVRGFYKSERDEERFAARSVPLRGEGSYSVILGYFYNEGFSQGVSLAQVFWTHGAKGQPERFYVVSERALEIVSDFKDFGRDIFALKKRLKKDPKIQLFDTFANYAQEYRRRMDIPGEKAMELFYQTVSMKQVGNLTEFVRAHMLDQPEVDERLEAIGRNFDNLNRAHEAVRKAHDQVSRLKPLMEDCDAYAAEEALRQNLTTCRDALHAFYGGKKLLLLRERLARLEGEEAKLVDLEGRNQEESHSLESAKVSLEASIRESGGGRLEAIARELEELERRRADRSARYERYLGWCRELKLGGAEDTNAFHENRSSTESVHALADEEKARVEGDRVELGIKMKERQTQADLLNEELDSLKGRRSSIPGDFLRVRARLSEEASIPESELPFAGELIQVRPEESHWEGALERLMRSFGLSMLVPAQHYSKIQRTVNAAHLGLKLVYYQVKDDEVRSRDHSSSRRTAAQKVQVLPDSPFKAWLEGQLAHQFDFACCDSPEEFEKLPKAITAQGQVKGGRRHEKDDRRRIGDKTQYVLGWDNKKKIDALAAQLTQLVEAEKKDRVALHGLESKIKAIDARKEAARDLLQVMEFQEIDWWAVVREKERLREEEKHILETSDLLQTLRTTLAGLETKIREARQKAKDLTTDMATVREKKSAANEATKEAVAILEALPVERQAELFPRLEEMRLEFLPDRKLTVETCGNVQTEHRDKLQALLDAGEKRRSRLGEASVKRMSEFKNAFPLETSDLAADLASAPEFRAFLHRLEEEDLPRHEKRFKELLNEQSINDIALFQNQLNMQQQMIKDKIAWINQSLKEIDYNPGSYIQLASERNLDAEVSQFQAQLRDCLEGTLSGEDNFYGEEKFQKVKDIVDRFRGREGLAEQDQKWTRKVTDVRNWFEFLVYERWKENDSDKDVYSDSSGKSGGQKEKLAYTILASALAYQFGLEWDEINSRRFRFVMIDEAFGRGSDDSAKYALTLFKKLNLQLLIVTPLQKIRVIEDFVRSVHFVHNDEGKASKLKNLSIEAHREERQRREGKDKRDDNAS